jgi:thioredoxin-like negative regulator of GroEL
MNFPKNDIVFLDDRDFAQQGQFLRMNSARPVLLAILSPSCPWCHKVVPVLAKLSLEQNFIVAVVYVNQSQIASRILHSTMIPGVPAFFAYKNSRLVDVYKGERTFSKMKEFILR